MSVSRKLFTLLRLIGLYTVMTLAFVSKGYSAEQIRADVVTDIAFIAPGETDTIEVRLENPANSGIVINEAVFSYNTTERQQAQLHPFLEIIDSTGCPMWANNANYGLKRDCETLSNDVFPVQPGQSVLLVYRYLSIADDATSGATISLENISLEMFDSSDRRLPILHLDRDVVRVVAEPNTTQPLPQLVTANPMAGSANMDMTLVLIPQERVDAGDPFTINGTLVNHSIEHFTVRTSLRGGYDREYQIPRCVSAIPCGNGVFAIAANESISGLEFRAEHIFALLKRGIWEIAAPYIEVLDSVGRVAYLYTDSVHIIIDHYTYLPTLATRQIQNRSF